MPQSVEFKSTNEQTYWREAAYRRATPLSANMGMEPSANMATAPGSTAPRTEKARDPKVGSRRARQTDWLDYM